MEHDQTVSVQTRYDTDIVWPSLSVTHSLAVGGLGLGLLLEAELTMLAESSDQTECFRFWSGIQICHAFSAIVTNTHTIFTFTYSSHDWIQLMNTEKTF